MRLREALQQEIEKLQTLYSELQPLGFYCSCPGRNALLKGKVFVYGDNTIEFIRRQLENGAFKDDKIAIYYHINEKGEGLNLSKIVLSSCNGRSYESQRSLDEQAIALIKQFFE